MNSENEGRLYFDFMGAVANAAPYKPNFTVHTEEMSRSDMQRLKDQGLNCFTLQIETLEPDLFPEICPGKAKHAPHERWIEALSDALDVFGVGNVGATTIGGLTLIPSNGHETWQEALAAHVEGTRKPIKMGVLAESANLRLPPGSVYGEKPANRDKIPPAEYYLDWAKAHHEACIEYGLYERLNKFMYCALDGCGRHYWGQLGWLAAGDLSKWIAPAVPKEANWLSDWIASVNSPATVGQ